MSSPIKHVGMWRLRGETAAERSAARTKVKTLLEGLKGRIDGRGELGDLRIGRFQVDDPIKETGA